MEGVLFSIVGVIGFFGNLLSILVLVTPQVSLVRSWILWLTTSHPSCGSTHSTGCWWPWHYLTWCSWSQQSLSTPSLSLNTTTGSLPCYTAGSSTHCPASACLPPSSWRSPSPLRGTGRSASLRWAHKMFVWYQMFALSGACLISEVILVCCMCRIYDICLV